VSTRRGAVLDTAVSRVEMTTAEQPGDGHRVFIEGGRVRVAELLSRPQGTTIYVLVDRRD